MTAATRDRGCRVPKRLAHDNSLAFSFEYLVAVTFSSSSDARELFLFTRKRSPPRSYTRELRFQRHFTKIPLTPIFTWSFHCISVLDPMHIAIEKYLHILHDSWGQPICTSGTCRSPERCAWCSSCLPPPCALRSPYYRSSLCLHVRLVHFQVGICADDAAHAHEESVERSV